MIKILKTGVLSSNQLKIIALVAMTIDHIGFYLMPQVSWLRVIGRLAFPIFAYMIAEGCTYTANRKRYLLKMIFVGLVCQIATYAAKRSLYMCIFITFSLSISVIWMLDYARKAKSIKSVICVAVAILAVLFITEVLPYIFNSWDFDVDYGFWGVMLPVAVYMASGKANKLICALAVMMMLSATSSLVQWYCLLAIVPLALYSGKRGNLNMKNLFYIYYPAHLLIINIIGYIIFVM